MTPSSATSGMAEALSITALRDQRGAQRTCDLRTFRQDQRHSQSFFDVMNGGRVARHAVDHRGEDVADAEAHAEQRDHGDASPEGLRGSHFHLCILPSC